MGFTVEELRNADLLRERGDLLIKQNERLGEAEEYFKKVLSPSLGASVACAVFGRQLCVADRCVRVSRHLALPGVFRTTIGQPTCVSHATSALLTSVCLLPSLCSPRHLLGCVCSCCNGNQSAWCRHHQVGSDGIKQRIG